MEKVFRKPTLEQFLHVCLDRAPDVDHSVNRLQFLLSSRMQNKSVPNGKEEQTYIFQVFIPQKLQGKFFKLMDSNVVGRRWG